MSPLFISSLPLCVFVKRYFQAVYTRILVTSRDLCQLQPCFTGYQVVLIAEMGVKEENYLHQISTMVILL